MKAMIAKPLFSALLLLALLPAQAATQDLDKLLGSIKDDIAAKRLSSPAGNNALERIDAFRAQAPFDFRVVPLTYQWGEAYVDMANKAIAAKEYDKAQQYLDKVWQVAALTPGLEDAQAKLDADYKGAPVVARVEQNNSKEDAERQKKLAEAAAKEKEKVEAERKRKAEEEKRLAAEEKKRADQERIRKQEEERQRRAETEKAEKEAAARRVAEAEKAATDKARSESAKTPAKAAPVVKAPAAAPIVVAAATKPREEKREEPKVTSARPEVDSETSKMWGEAKEDSAPIASYPVSADLLSGRNRDIVDSLTPMCQAILDNDASVVVHTQDKADYRWLTVRLTLCLRRLDKTFRLRHSYEAETDGKPFVSLHPPREVSLVRKVTD